MKIATNRRSSVAALLALALAAGTAMAQHDHAQDGAQPKPQAQSAAPKADERVGDPYPFDTCPISGKKLGAMGDAIVKVYDGREVRFCCEGCPPKFEKDLAASFATLDEKIIKDQGPLYPLKTSLITGKDLPAKPVEFVYGNRLVRFGAPGEKADFLKEPKKYLAALDKAVIEKQGADYVLTSCPVSQESLGSMGKPVDVVVAGRLVRLCCKSCKKDLGKDPAKFIAMVDEARKTKVDHTKDGDHGHKDAKHGG